MDSYVHFRETRDSKGATEAAASVAPLESLVQIRLARCQFDLRSVSFHMIYYRNFVTIQHILLDGCRRLATGFFGGSQEKNGFKKPFFPDCPQKNLPAELA